MKSLAVTVLIGFFSIAAKALSCETEQLAFAKLNEPLIIRNNADARTYSSIEESATLRLHRYVNERILNELNSSRVVRTTNVVRRIRCIQSLVPEYARAGEVTNAPLAFHMGGDGSAIAVVYELYRGGAGAPDIRPYFEVFRRISSGWTLDGSTGSDFVGCSFFVNRIHSGERKGWWFLLSGKRIGASQSRLRLEIVGYNGSALRHIWGISGLSNAYLAAVFGDHILLRHVETDSKGREISYEERWEVVPDGLKMKRKRAMPPPKGSGVQ